MMKVRLGFVSNSSTSSFVILGFNASPVVPKGDKYDDFVCRLEDCGFAVVHSDEGEPPIIVGKMLSQFYDRGIQGTDIPDLQSMLPEIETVKSEIGANTSIRLYLGTITV